MYLMLIWPTEGELGSGDIYLCPCDYTTINAMLSSIDWGLVQLQLAAGLAPVFVVLYFLFKS